MSKEQIADNEVLIKQLELVKKMVRESRTNVAHSVIDVAISRIKELEVENERLKAAIKESLYGTVFDKNGNRDDNGFNSYIDHQNV